MIVADSPSAQAMTPSRAGLAATQPALVAQVLQRCGMFPARPCRADHLQVSHPPARIFGRRSRWRRSSSSISRSVRRVRRVPHAARNSRKRDIDSPGAMPGPAGVCA